MRIDFFDSEGLYNVLSYFTEQLCHSLSKLDVECRIYNVYNGELQQFIQQLSQPPDFTCSFSGKSCFNYDSISNHTQIPHISYCIDSPIYYLKLFENPRNVVTFVDRSIVEVIDSKIGNLFYLAQGADHSLLESQQEEKCFEVLMIGACFDYENIRQTWLHHYPPHLSIVMEEAIERIFAKDAPSFPQAILMGIRDRSILIQETDFLKMCHDIENYMRGKDRFELIKSIKNAPITIFGPTRFGPKKWSEYLGIFPNITFFEGECSFKETFSLIKKSKIYLNSCPSLKDGAHERVFNGFLLDSLVLTNETNYYKDFFRDGEDILFYQPGKWNEVDDKIDYYLSNDNARQEMTSKGKEIVLNNHTWDHRARQLLQIINQYLINHSI